MPTSSINVWEEGNYWRSLILQCVMNPHCLQLQQIGEWNFIFRQSFFMQTWNNFLSESFLCGRQGQGFENYDRPSNLDQIRFILSQFWPVWSCNLIDDLKNNRAPLLCYAKLCASFRSHQWIPTGVIVPKCSIRVKLIILVVCDLEGWPWKQIGTSSMLPNDLCIISRRSVNQKWSYTP